MVPKCLENCPILPRYSYSMSELCSLSSTYGLRHLGFALNAFVVKVILAGASGLIGSELLSQLVQNSSITSIIILSRRPLDKIAASDPRIKVFVIENFLEYEDEVVKEMEGAKAVFWMLGGSNSKQTPSEKMDEVEIQYPLALARALISSRQAAKESENSETKLRFLFVSGEFSVRDQSKTLWFLEQGRKARGEAENKLFELAEQNQDIFETVVIKCAYVVPKESMMPDLVVGLSRNAIRVDELGAAMIHCALDRHGSETVGNTELRNLGRKVLSSEEARRSTEPLPA